MKKKQYRLIKGEEEGLFLLEDARDRIGCDSNTIRKAVRTGREIYGYTVKEDGEIDLHRIRQCAGCGKTMESQKATLYCNECRKQPQSKKKQKSPNALKPLSRLAREAREAGMSYGKYVGIRHQRGTEK